VRSNKTTTTTPARKISTTNKPISENKKENSKVDPDKIAEEIVSMVSSVLNQRNGIGEVWRLLHNNRKNEIKSKWKHEIVEILKNK
jgi:predicted nucleotide-binding protein (sugar kinase/HSP70/actin superfamily)